MIKKSPCLILCLASVLLFGCTVKQNTEQFFKNTVSPKTELPLTGRQTSSAQMLPQFDSIAVNGPYDIQFEENPNPYSNSSRTSSITIIGDSGIVDYTHVFVKNNTMSIYLDPAYAYTENVKAKVTVQTTAPLNRVYYNGSGSMNIQNINVDHFSASVNGSAYMFLAGVTNRFDATATGVSRLNATCLVAHATFVNTTDLAQAEVLGGPGVSGLAAGQSDVYYFSRPEMVAPYQRQSGSVMAMDGIMPANAPLVQAEVVPSTSQDFGIK